MLRLSSSLLLCTVLAAQQTSAQPTAAANRFVPADSCVVVRMAAPAKWKQGFGKTQIAKLMQAPTIEPIVMQVTKGMDAALDQLRQSGKFDADLVDKMMRDYKGDITFSVQVDWNDLAASMQEDRPPAFSMVVALSPDAGYDLAALGNAMQQAVEKETASRRPLKDLVVGDVRLRVTTDQETMHACVPTMVDGHLVMVIGSDLEKAAARAFATDKRYEGTIGDKPLFVHARLDQAMAALLAAMDEQLAGMVPFDINQLMSDIGFSALEGMTLSLDAVDKHADAEIELTLGKGDPGIFATMLVDQQPKMLKFVPADANWFGISHSDFNALYTVVGKVWEQLADQVPMSMADAEAAFAESTKVRLKEDLLAHLGTEMLTLQAEDADADDENNPFAVLGGTCFALSLRDGKAFGQSLETALRAHGLHAARKTEEYGDQKVYRLRLAAVLDIEYAVTDDMLLVVIGKGEGGSRNLRAVLDAKKAGSGEGPAVLQKALGDLPAGWTGVSVAPVAGAMKTLTTMLKLGAARADDEQAETMEQATKAMEGLAADARRLGIEHIVSVAYTTPRSMRMRMRL